MIRLRPIHRLCLAALVAVTAVASPAAAQEPAPAAAPGAFSVYLPSLAAPGAPQSARPSIQSFSASPSSAAPGAAVTLSWAVTGATSLSISPGVGAVSGTSVQVRPQATTAYTLTAANAAGSVTASATVLVQAPEPGANPLTIKAVAGGQAATKEIGPSGGELSATGANGVTYRLSIPAGSLAFTETISLAPMAASGLPFAAGSLGAVAIEPAGLFLAEPATLTVSGVAAPPAGARPLAYAYDGAGAEFHLHPLGGPAPQAELAAGTASVTMQASVLRGYGATAGTPAEIGAHAAKNPPTDALDRVDQEVTANLRAEALARVRADFAGRILPLMRSAETNADLADRAIEQWGRWFGFVERHGFKAELADEIATGKVRVINILENATRRSSGRCLNDGRVEEGFALLRWLHYTRKYLPGAPIADIQAALEKCLRFKVTFHSIIEEKGDGYGYHYELKSTVNLRWAGGMRVTGAAQLDYVDARWIGGGPCTFDTVGVGSYFEARNEGQGLTIAPVSRTSPETKLSFTYDPGKPAERVTIICDKPMQLPETNAWKEYYDEMHIEEWSGGGYTATEQVSRVASFLGWNYVQSTTGPGGQAVTEETTINLEHTPAR